MSVVKTLQAYVFRTGTVMLFGAALAQTMHAVRDVSASFAVQWKSNFMGGQMPIVHSRATPGAN